MIVHEFADRAQAGSAQNHSHSQIPQAFQRMLTPLRVQLTAAPAYEAREMGLIEAIERIGRSSEPVWITAEVGAGAVWLAQLLHDQTGNGGPFIREDCDPEHGLQFAPGSGILFLCAPERLSSQHQRELLDHLSQTNLKHLEGLRTIPPFPRTIAWSQTGATTLTQSGRILPGLAQALGKIQISVPPLRVQRDVIEDLARAILDQIATHEGLIPRELAPGALDALRGYSWPGNLTELHSLLERACLLADPDRSMIEADDFQPLLLQSEGQETPTLATAREHRPRPMSEIEAEAIRDSIDWNSGNLVRAARELRIGRATLYRKLKKYGIPTRTQRKELAR